MRVSRLLIAASVVCVGLGLAGPRAASATETVTYTYDARGRLIKVVRTGSVNNGVTSEYTHDRASNRTKVKTTGAPS